MKTWRIEAVVHAVVMGGVTLAQYGGSPRAVPGSAWLLLAAVLAFAAVGRITDRLGEKLKAEGLSLPTVECAAKLPRALWTGRVLLAAYLWTLGAWVSLASLTWDCLYPLWRRAYRARRPVQRSSLVVFPSRYADAPEPPTPVGGAPLTLRRK